MADIKAIAEELVNLTVKEVNELATVLKDEYGIEPAAAAVAVAAGPAAGAAAAAEEKTSFDVVLAEIGSAKLQVVKAVKELVVLVLRRLRISLMVLLLLSKRVFLRTRLRTLRRPSRPLVPRLSLSKLHIFIEYWLGFAQSVSPNLFFSKDEPKGSRLFMGY